MEKFGKFMLGFIVTIIGIIVCGFVLSVLWKWFVVATFGVKAITVAQAIGLSVMVKTFRGIKKVEEKFEFEKYVSEIISYGIVSPFLVLGIGWIITLFM